MSIATEKLVVAGELLNRALRMYYEGDSYFAALHLAGGAEEVLGVYVERHGGKSSFRSLQHGAVRISKILNGGIESKHKAIARIMNHAKNSTKHMEVEDDDYVHFEATMAAKELLERAVSNYYFLMSFHELPETDLISRFNLEHACVA